VIRFVLKLMLILIAVVTLFGETITPYTENYANQYRAELRAGGKALATKQGVWLRQDNTFAHIEKILPHDKLVGVTQYSFDKNRRLYKTSYTKRGEYIKSGSAKDGSGEGADKHKKKKWSMGAVRC